MTSNSTTGSGGKIEQPGWKNITDSVIAVAALAGVGVSLFALFQAIDATQQAEADAKQTIDNQTQANRLASVHKISWFPYRKNPGDPYEVRVENHSLFPAYKTMLRRIDGKGSYYMVKTLTPCTRVVIHTGATNNEIADTPENYSLEFRNAGKWWATNKDRDVSEVKNKQQRGFQKFYTANRFGSSNVPLTYEDLSGCG